MRNLLLLVICCFMLWNCDSNKAEANLFPANKKVLVIGIDGCRSDVLTNTIAPFMNSLQSKSTVTYNLEHKTETITISGPNWASICTGVHHEKHQITDNIFQGNDLSSYPHFFKYINQYYGNEQVNLVSYAVWFPINYFMTMLEADHSPVEFNYTDQQVYDLSAATLKDNAPIDPDVLFIHFDQLDHEGHAYGYHPDTIEYIQAVANVDNYVKGLYDIIDARKEVNNEDWLVVIVSDHGGLGYGHDGGENIPEIKNTILFLDNPSLTSGVIDTSQQVDIVPTILDFLEMDYSSFDLDGRSLLE